MPATDIENSLAALNRRVANFLLAWRNAGSCGGFDFSDLWMVDTAIAEDIQAVIRLIATSHDYPTAYGLKPQFERLVADWRPHLLAPAPK